MRLELLLLCLLVLSGTLIGAPFSPVPLEILLEFPPKQITLHHISPRHPEFHSAVWIGYAAVGTAMFYLLLRAAFCSSVADVRWENGVGSRNGFYYGAGLVLVGLTLSWSRFAAFDSFRPFAFPILWLGYIAAVEASLSALGRRPSWQVSSRYFLLFPYSAIFWWSFEYLNRFVQNWSYQGAETYSPTEYLFYASIAFSTVLPAVVGTTRLLLVLNFPGKLVVGPPVQLSKLSASIVLLLGEGMLVLTVIRPHECFALLWVAPVILAIALSYFFPRNHLRAELESGNWRLVVSSALAAFICGLFWEGWNYPSVLRWVYHIPYVEKFYLFEMPIVGFAGYLPFGLLCVIVGQWVVGGSLFEE